ncbi:MAG: protein usg [Hyphomicrobiales bacterium]
MKGLPMIDKDFACQLKGWSLTTAEIMYHMPDHRDLLQMFVWQDYDLAPRFPRLIKFLDFWSHNLDGPLSTIRVAHAGISGPAEMRYVDQEWRLH